MKNLSIFLFVFVLCMIGNVYGGNPFKGKKTAILFRNSLSHNKWLKVVCKSGSTKPIVHYMKPREDWGFHFRDGGFVQNTLYWCTLSQGSAYRVSATFDAYVQDRRKPHGGSYNYFARDDGIYHSNFVEASLHKVHDWKY